tara:strand:+ start:657 stop:1547 length:891 start_codon:yes stop_codon:yes gene_type:complete
LKALIFVSILWAFSFGLIKGQLTGIDPSLVSAIRLLLCALVFIPFLRFATQQKLSVQLLGLGALQFGVMYWAYIQSYQFLPGYLVAVLTIFTPIYVYLFASFLERRFNAAALVAIIGSIIGAAIIVYKAPNDESWLMGFAILQIANLAFAIGQVGYRHITHLQTQATKPTIREHANHMAIMYMGGAIFGLIVIISNGAYQGVDNINANQWLVLLYLGIVASGLGFACWNYGAKQVSPQTLAVMNNGYIPFAVIFSLTLFGESADLTRLLAGLVLMVGSLIFLEKGVNKRRVKNELS